MSLRRIIDGGDAVADASRLRYQPASWVVRECLGRMELEKGRWVGVTDAYLVYAKCSSRLITFHLLFCMAGSWRSKLNILMILIHYSKDCGEEILSLVVFHFRMKPRNDS